MTTTDLAATIRSVKAQVSVPITYADVWSIGSRTGKSMTRSISSPSTSCPIGDFPIRASLRGHVDSDPPALAVAFPGKEI